MRLYIESAYPPYSFKNIYWEATMCKTLICIGVTTMYKDKYYYNCRVDTIVAEVWQTTE